jgi:hypothetical protein
MFFKVNKFCEIGFYNEADTLESSSVLIYSQKEQSIYTHGDWHDAVYIKKVITIKALIKSVGS